MASNTTTMSENGQVLIPSEIRHRLGLRPGDRFEVDIRDDELVLRVLPRGPLLA